MYINVHSCYCYAQTSLYSFNDLPDWLYQINVDDSLISHAIGISDPGMEKENAYIQAKMRASALLALNERFQFNKMFDSYKEQKDGGAPSKKSSSNLTLNCKFDTLGVVIKEVYFSEYKECYIKVSKSKEIPGSNIKPFSLEASLFSSVNESNRSVNQGIISVNITDNQSDTKYSYSKYFLDKKLDITSGIGDSIIPFTNYKYRYNNLNVSEEDSDEDYSEYLGNSFWDGYITSIIRSTAFYFNSDASASSKSENINSKTQAYNRILVDKFYQLNITNMSIIDNRIHLLVEINELP